MPSSTAARSSSEAGEGRRMDIKMPKTIYLQVEDHYGDSLEIEDGMTWCWERINESDVAYVLESKRDALRVKLADVTKWCDHYRGRVSELVLDRDVLLEQRDALQARLKLAEGLAEAMETEARVEATPYHRADRRSEPPEAILERYWLLARAISRQALAAWRAES